MKFYDNFLGPFENFMREKNEKEKVAKQAERDEEIKTTENSYEGSKPSYGHSAKSESEERIKNKSGVTDSFGEKVSDSVSGINVTYKPHKYENDIDKIHEAFSEVDSFGEFKYDTEDDFEIALPSKKLRLSYSTATQIDDFLSNNTTKNKRRKAEELDTFVDSLGLADKELEDAQSYAGLRKLSFMSHKTGENSFMKEFTQPFAKFAAGIFDNVDSLSQFAVKNGFAVDGEYSKRKSEAISYYKDNPDKLGNDYFSPIHFDVDVGGKKLSVATARSDAQQDYLDRLALENLLEYYDDTMPLTKAISNYGARNAGRMMSAATLVNALGVGSAVSGTANGIKNVLGGTKVGKSVADLANASPKIKAYASSGIKGNIINKTIDKVNEMSVAKAAGFLNPVENPVLTLMGVSVAQQKFDTLTSMGYSSDKAKKNALFTGYVAAITEKMSFNGIPGQNVELIKGGGARQAIRVLGEGAEEVVNLAFERIGDIFSDVGYIGSDGQLKKRGLVGKGGVIDAQAYVESFCGGTIGGVVMQGIAGVSSLKKIDTQSLKIYPDLVRKYVADFNNEILLTARQAGISDIKLPELPNFKYAGKNEIDSFINDCINAYKTIITDRRAQEYDGTVSELIRSCVSKSKKASAVDVPDTIDAQDATAIFDESGNVFDISVKTPVNEEDGEASSNAASYFSSINIKKPYALIKGNDIVKQICEDFDVMKETVTIRDVDSILRQNGYDGILFYDEKYRLKRAFNLEDIRIGRNATVYDDFSNKVDMVFRGMINYDENGIIIEDTPYILKKYGASDRKLTITPKTLYKIAYPQGYLNGKHNLGIPALKRLYEQLADPMAIMKSNTQDNSMVVLTEWEDAYGSPVIIPIHIDKQGAVKLENRVASAYGTPSDAIYKDVIYTKNDKRIKQILSDRLQLPATVSEDTLIKYIVSQGGVNVKELIDDIRAFESRLEDESGRLAAGEYREYMNELYKMQ